MLATCVVKADRGGEEGGEGGEGRLVTRLEWGGRKEIERRWCFM